MTAGATTSIRAAVPADADEIAAIDLAVARHAYADLEPRRVAFLELEDLQGEWRSRLDPVDLLTGEELAVVAELGDRVVGVASWLVPRSDRTQPVRHATLAALMVHPAAQNAGVGTELLAAAEERLREERGGDGDQTAQLALHREAWWAASFLGSRGWVRRPDAPADAGPDDTWERTL